ncbi:class I SAM-dependent methyltransferase [Sedimenticola selenatireducens]|nr:class I SAM-dependent methyltransferase [Sedimenticola selenatireducens]
MRKLMPGFVRRRLWGDREKYGLEIDYDDACWKQWQKIATKAYNETQKKGIGRWINDAGYKIMSEANLNNSTVLEIGAGDINHSIYWGDNPSYYYLADVHEDMLEKPKKVLEKLDIEYCPILIKRQEVWPIADETVDVVISFYSLEHLYPLDFYIEQIKRVLKPGGVLVGAVPTEGGILWGVGRYLTTRRWFTKNTEINYDKIICWEHPNYADKIIHQLDQSLTRQSISFWPLGLFKWMDINLIARFVYKK